MATGDLEREQREVFEVEHQRGEVQRGDAVLDVKQIARWAGCIGNRTTVVPIVDAKHDVFLSLPGPRRAAFDELEKWLDWYLEWTQSAHTATHYNQG